MSHDPDIVRTSPEHTREHLARIIQVQNEIIGAGLDLTSVMQTIAQRAQELAGGTGGVLELVEGSEMVYHSVSGTASNQLGLRLDRATSLSGLAVAQDKILTCNDSELDPRVDREACRKVGARSMVVVPLRANAQPVGVLKVLSREPGVFHSEAVDTLSIIAHTVGTALTNARFHQQREDLIAELTESRERFRQLAVATFEAIVMSKNGMVVEVNDNYLRLFGYERHEVMGQTAQMFIDPRDYESVLTHIDQQSEAIFESRCVRKDGTVFLCALRMGWLVSDSGSLRITAMRDITEQRRYEDELHTARIAAEEANRSKSQFLATMSHELRTPLNGIIGFTDLVLDETYGPLTEDQRESLQMVLTSSRHLLHLINDILDLSKIEAGKLELVRERFVLVPAMEEVTSALLPLAREKAIALKIETGIGSKEVMLDRHKFKQILYNLISNAIKFTPQNGRIDVRFKQYDHTFELSVCDTGIGIREDDMQYLFQAFRQIDSSYNRKYQGTGLGLALTKQLVELHGGSITVTSAFGEGTTFTVTLPEPHAIPEKVSGSRP